MSAPAKRSGPEGWLRVASRVGATEILPVTTRGNGGNEMERIKLTGVCLVMMCAVFAAGTTSALAIGGSLEYGKCTAKAGGKFKNAGCTKLAGVLAEEQKYEWAPLSSPVKFAIAKSFETSMVYELENGTEVGVTDFTGTGEFANSQEMRNVVFHWSGFDALGGECTSEGQLAGNVVTKTLHGGLGIVKKELNEEKNIDGMDFKGQVSESFAEFSCVGVPWLVRSGIIVEARAFEKNTSNKMFNKLRLEFISEKPAKQFPERFEGGLNDFLETKVGGGSYEQTGIAAIVNLTTEPKTTKVELRQCGASC
jgi:hypothetical protein